MTELNRIAAILVSIAFTSVALLASCRSKPDGKVSFMVFGDPAEYAAYGELVEVFEDEYQSIEITLQHVPSQAEYRQRLAAGFSGGEPPDVMLINYRRFATFAQQGGLHPLTQYLDESSVISEKDFFPIAFDSFVWQEELWCVPQNVSSLVVYYNRNLFDAAGLAYPEDSWNWLNFIDAARALTLDQDGDGAIDQYGVGLEPNLFRLAPFIWQNGGRLVDKRDAPTKLALDEKAAFDALTWFVKLQTLEHVVPDAVAEAAETSESRFLNGTLGMIFNSRRGVPTYRTINAFEWDVAPLPIGRQRAGILHSDGYCMAAAAADKDAAWTFIEFANSNRGQEIVAATGRTVPSLISVAESPAFLDPALPPANSRVFLETMPSLERVPVMSTWVAIEETTSREIERAFYGQVSVEQAVQSALSLTQQYFQENQLVR